MKNRIHQLAMLASVLVAAPVLAQNVALNKPVTVVSGAGSLLPPAPAPGVITDGAFLPETTNYSAASAVTGSMRWNSGIDGGTVFEVDLGGLHTIDGIIVQADDNDSLIISYLDSNNTYQPLYTVPIVSVGFGFVTRPSGDQTTWFPLSPIDTTTIRITNVAGDDFYGISELQLRGVLVPEPTTLAALAGVGVLALRRR